jgi:hypothetical protein
MKVWVAVGLLVVLVAWSSFAAGERRGRWGLLVEQNQARTDTADARTDSAIAKADTLATRAADDQARSAAARTVARPTRERIVVVSDTVIQIDSAPTPVPPAITEALAALEALPIAAHPGEDRLLRGRARDRQLRHGYTPSGVMGYLVRTSHAWTSSGPSPSRL